MGITTKIKQFFFVKLRICKYKMLSNCKRVTGKPVLFHPLLLLGKGTISFGTNVQIGVVSSPNYYSHYTYLEARSNDSSISIGNNVSINNGFSAESLQSITIKDDVLIGVQCSIIDNDGHDLDATKRSTGIPKSDAVVIEKNVFIGDNVAILKGVVIGENSVIGNGSIVTQSIPSNAIAAGNPARVIRNL